jgi:hypothetical protein
MGGVKHPVLLDFLESKANESKELKKTEDEEAAMMFATYFNFDAFENEGRASTPDQLDQGSLPSVLGNGDFMQRNSAGMHYHSKSLDESNTSVALKRKIFHDTAEILSPWGAKASRPQITQTLQQDLCPGLGTALTSPLSRSSVMAKLDSLILGFRMHLSKRSVGDRWIEKYCTTAAAFNQFVINGGCSIAELMSNVVKRDSLRRAYSNIHLNNKNDVSGLSRYCEDFLPTCDIDQQGNLVSKPVFSPQNQGNEKLPVKRRHRHK